MILSPTGPYIRDQEGKGISLLAMSDQVRAWPGGTGGHKLGLNYAPGFVAQRTAAALGYQQLLWLLGETIAEAGAMNVFAVFERTDGGKCFPSSASSHPPSRLISVSRSARCSHAPTGRHDLTRRDARLGAFAPLTYPTHRRTPPTPRRRPPTHCRAPTDDVRAFRGYGPAARIGWQRRVGGDGADAEMQIQDIVLPVVGGEGSLAQALWERLVDIQEGRVEWEGWGVPCDVAVT